MLLSLIPKYENDFNFIFGVNNHLMCDNDSTGEFLLDT